MNNEDAENLSILLLQISKKLEESVAFVKDRDSEENFLRYREGIGKVMGQMYFKVKEPFWDRFPELKPESLDGPYEVDGGIYEPHFYLRARENT